jgi:hypothetical protein
LILQERAPDALMLLAASDHAIDDVPALLAAVQIGARAAAQGRLVTFGIKPTRPETGYGYIRRGGPLDGIDGAFAVGSFVEKPDRSTAEKFLRSGGYFWNASLFLFSPGVYLAELAKYAPDILAKAREALDKGRRDLDFLRLDKDIFASCPSNSIDYAVMERTERAAVVPADIGWSDVGSWSTLWERGRKDADGNALTGDVVVEDSRDNLIRSAGRRKTGHRRHERCGSGGGARARPGRQADRRKARQSRTIRDFPAFARLPAVGLFRNLASWRQHAGEADRGQSWRGAIAAIPSQTRRALGRGLGRGLDRARGRKLRDEGKRVDLYPHRHAPPVGEPGRHAVAADRGSSR